MYSLTVMLLVVAVDTFKYTGKSYFHSQFFFNNSSNLIILPTTFFQI